MAGAFDRVRLERIVAKLKSKGLHPQIIAVLASWLRQRIANVVVGGISSDEMPLLNMVYQGTVTGPMLWNVFFEDARRAINEWFYTEVVYADDLNAYRIFSSTVSNDIIKKTIDSCQHELHEWGAANQVSFDASKESQHILSMTDPWGGSFKLLGVTFDVELTMTEAVSEIVTEAGWKLRTLLRTKRFYTDADLITLYKAHLLSFLEYRTPAVYHATRAVLHRLDAVHTRFLNDVGVSELTALIVFRLAPLATRRDIAMLGLVHRAVLGKGPPQLADLFRRRGTQLRPGSLHDPRHDCKAPVIKRSAYGLAAVYNMLPHPVLAMRTVSSFQRRLQDMVTEHAKIGFPQWSEMLSPRATLASHPLVSLSRA